MRPLKIVVDIRMLFSSGIGTYLENLLTFLQESNHHIVTLGRWGAIKTNAPIYSLREHWDIPLKIPRCDIYWTPHFNAPLLPIKAKNRVITIHDLYHLVHLHKIGLRKRFVVKKIITSVIERAVRVICVSEFSKNQILQFFPEAEKKIHVIYSGSGHQFLNKSMKVPGIEFPFFLFVGSGKEHKNFPLLLDAFKKFCPFSPEEIHLVVVGPTKTFDREKLFSQIPTLIKDKIHFIGTVSEEQLGWLYQKAHALIFPSLHEGWGFPPLEAMRFGCPVLASHAASIPEACGEAACYFNPFNAEELCEKMLQLPKERAKLIEAGLQRITQLSWKESAQRHRQLFEELAFS